MFAFYDLMSGEILSLVQTSSQPAAPSGHGYVVYDHDKSDMHKYEVLNGELQKKAQSKIDAIELAEAQEKLRRKRNQVLANTDWTQSPDSPLSDAKKAEWRSYRQALRDLPANTTDPANIIWPSKP